MLELTHFNVDSIKSDALEIFKWIEKLEFLTPIKYITSLKNHIKIKELKQMFRINSLVLAIELKQEEELHPENMSY